MPRAHAPPLEPLPHISRLASPLLAEQVQYGAFSAQLRPHPAKIPNAAGRAAGDTRFERRAWVCGPNDRAHARATSANATSLRGVCTSVCKPLRSALARTLPRPRRA